MGGIFIKGIMPGSQAERSGRIKKGKMPNVKIASALFCAFRTENPSVMLNRSGRGCVISSDV